MKVARTTLAVLAVAAGAVLATWAVLSEPLLILLAGGLVLAVAVTNRPAVALTIWLASLLFVPYWIGVDLGGLIPPPTLVAVALIPALWSARKAVRISPLDILVIAGMLATSAAAVVAGSPAATSRSILVGWLPAYIVVRILSARIGGRKFAIIFVALAVIAAAWSLIEFAADFHPFTALESTAAWNEIQSRGGQSRSEGAFGHSIVMGGVLASAVPFALTMPGKVVWKLAAVVVLLGGTLVTFSRGGITAALLCLGLTLILSPRRSFSITARMAVSIGLLLAAILVAPQVLSVFDSSQAETAASSQYRENIFAVFAQDVAFFGPGAGLFEGPTGLVYQGFTSVDNAYALGLLQFGWVPMILLLSAPIAVAVLSLRWRTGPAGVALIGQLVLIGTVALILQLAPLLFALAAVGVSAFTESPTAAKSRELARSTSQSG